MQILIEIIQQLKSMPYSIKTELLSEPFDGFEYDRTLS